MATTNIFTNPIFLIGSALFSFRKPIYDKINKLLGRPPRLEPGEVLVTLDHGMPQPMVMRCLQEICYLRDPAALDSSAAQLAALGYPLASSELRSRAATLRAKLPAAPSPCADIDPSLDARTCAAVKNAIWYGRDPAALESFAATLRGVSPNAANLLSQRAVSLREAAAKAAPPAGETPNAQAAPAAGPDLVAPIEKNVAADAAAQVVEDIAAVAGDEPPAPARARGHYVTIRATDRIRSDNLAKIGSGGEKNAHLKLIGGNPHLAAASGVLPEFLPAGSEVSIPSLWAGRLRERGFAVSEDSES